MHIPSHLLLVNQTKQHFLHSVPQLILSVTYLVFSTFKSFLVIVSTFIRLKCVMKINNQSRTFASTAALQVRLPTLTPRSLTAVFALTRFLRALSYNNITLCLGLYLIAAVVSDVDCSRWPTVRTHSGWSNAETHSCTLDTTCFEHMDEALQLSEPWALIHSQL